MTIAYDYATGLYLNITNRCPCNCSFCVRRHSISLGGLWLPREPALEEIEAAIPMDFSQYDEVVFCGYGEPCERLEALLYTSSLIKERTDLPIRLNTNGLSDLINGKRTAPLLAAGFDRISISLNAPDAETYYALCNPSFGKDSFNEVIRFALECMDYFDHVTCSVVRHALTESQLAKCVRLCERLGLRLRIR